MLKLTAVLALLASPAFGLTDLEIGAFRAGPVSCISDDVTTNGSILCGSVSISTSPTTLTLTSNSVPSNGGQSSLSGFLYRDIFRNFCLPIIPSVSSLTVPLNPTKNPSPSCVPQTVGYALDGVQIWNQYAPENLGETGLSNIPDDLPIGVDAGQGLFAEPMDECSGHPGPEQAYHYHKLPAHGLGWESICFADEAPGSPSGILGVAVDGFPIYGPFDVKGEELTPEDLDECNGMDMPDGSYRYIVTNEFPYGPGCMWGTTNFPSDQLCWFAKDWLAAMETTGQEYYRDCDAAPVPESTGTEGCLSYYSNPNLYEREFGDLKGWQTKYDETCGSKEWMATFAGKHPELGLTGTLLAAAGPAGEGGEATEEKVEMLGFDVDRNVAKDVGIYSAGAIVAVGAVAVAVTKYGKGKEEGEGGGERYVKLGTEEQAAGGILI